MLEVILPALAGFLGVSLSWAALSIVIPAGLAVWATLRSL